MPTSITPIRVANANTDRYIHDLRAAYAGLRIYDPDFAIDRDPWIYEKMLRDPLIRQCLGHRMRSVAGGDWSIVAARGPTEKDEEAARVMDQAIGELENKGFQSSRVNLARFVWEGSRHAAVNGKRRPRPYGDGKVRDWWFPTKLRDLPKRRVRVWREGGKVVKKLVPVFDEQGVDFDYYGRDWPEDRIITAVYDDEESRLGFGRGLGDSCYWFFFLKWKLIEEGVDAVREWLQALIIVKTDTVNLGDVSQTSTSTRDALTAALVDAKRKGVVAIGKEDDVDGFDATGKGSEALLKWLHMLDDGLRGVITGAKLNTGGGDDKAGSLARGEVEERTSEGIYQLDSKLLDEAMTGGLIKPVWDRNRENLIELGLVDARMPSYRSINEPREDREQNSRLLKDALESGAMVKKDEFYEMLGLTPPTKEDIEAGNVIEPKEEPDPFGGGGGNPFEQQNGNGEKRKPQNGQPPKPKQQGNRIQTSDTPADFMFAAPWDEGKHPRKKDGEFAPKGGGESSGAVADEKSERARVTDGGDPYPAVGDTVDGRVVRDPDNIPNTDSIEATIEDADVLPGIRDVAMWSFTLDESPAIKPGDKTAYGRDVLELAAKIKESGEISPLIVAVDEQGPYIIEGAHRFDALKVLGAKSFPALVVLDGVEREDLAYPEANADDSTE